MGRSIGSWMCMNSDLMLHQSFTFNCSAHFHSNARVGTSLNIMHSLNSSQQKNIVQTDIDFH